MLRARISGFRAQARAVAQATLADHAGALFQAKHLDANIQAPTINQPPAKDALKDFSFQQQAKRNPKLNAAIQEFNELHNS